MIEDKTTVTPGKRARAVLYVEDHPANLKLVELFLTRRPDIDLLSASNGKSGLEMASLARPDVIVMDINLPDISGFKALEILRADPATAHIPVVALSANALPLNIESGLEAGFFRYLTKPIQSGAFLEALDLAFAHAQKNVARRKQERPGTVARPGIVPASGK